MKHQIHKGLIGLHVRTHHRNIPIPGSAGRQLPHPVGCQQALGVNTSTADNLQSFPGLALLNASLKQLFPYRAQSILPGGDHLHGNGNPRPLGGVVQSLCRFPGLFKGQQLGIYLVAVQADGDILCILHQKFQNCQVLSCKIRKSVYVKHMLLSERSFLQLLQEPGHLVSGIPLSPGAQAVVALHEQCQLLQLLGKRPLRLPGGPH